MSEEQNILEQAVEAIQKLLGFGETDQIASMVNGITQANGDENGIVAALKGFFGNAIADADLLSVVKDFLGQGNGLDLNNILGLFQGIGDKVGGFDKIAGLVGAAANAGGVTDAVKSVTDAVSGAAEGAANAAGDAAGAAANTVKAKAGSVTGAVREVSGQVEKPAKAVTQEVNKVEEPSGKRKKKWPIVVGVIAAVCLLAGIGVFIWHEQPSFCAAICHEPMDAYLEGYDQEDNAPGSDKYGNEVTNTHSMLAVSHKSQNLACLNCHIPSIEQQIHEGMMMLNGSYTVLAQVDGSGFGQIERNLSQLQENAGHPNDSGKGDEFCLRSGCHDTDRETLSKTQVLEGTIVQPHMWLNIPHASAGNMEFACGDCHKSHRASVNLCTQCHNDNSKIPLESSSMPEGWVTFMESQQMMNAVGA